MKRDRITRPDWGSSNFTCKPVRFLPAASGMPHWKSKVFAASRMSAPDLKKDKKKHCYFNPNAVAVESKIDHGPLERHKVRAGDTSGAVGARRGRPHGV